MKTLVCFTLACSLFVGCTTNNTTNNNAGGSGGSSSGGSNSGGSSNQAGSGGSQAGSSNGGSSNGGSGNGACPSIAGTWTVSGECGPDLCSITQTGCDTDFQCSGASSYKGTIAANGDVTYAGKTAGGLDGTCTGKLSGDTVQGTCKVAGQSCAYTAQRNGGGQAGSGGSSQGGSGGSAQAGSGQAGEGQGGSAQAGSGGSEQGGSGGSAQAGSGGSGGTQSGSCPSVAGAWEMTGTCGNDVCAITQTTCDLDLACTTIDADQGAVDANGVVTFQATVQGIPATCTGQLSGSQLSGACSALGISCVFQGTKK